MNQRGTECYREVGASLEFGIVGTKPCSGFADRFGVTVKLSYNGMNSLKALVPPPITDKMRDAVNLYSAQH